MPDLSYQNWLSVRKDTVLDFVQNSINKFAASSRQSELLIKAVQVYPAFRAHPDSAHPYIHVPLLVYAGITGDDSGAIPVSGVALMIRIASKLYDDFMDGDLSEEWMDSPHHEIFDTVLTLACLLPYCVLADLDIKPANRLEMQQLLSESLLKMLAGQSQDLANKNQAFVSSQDVEASVIGKSGAAIALTAGLAAKLADAPLGVTRAYMDFGLALGVLNLVVKDIYEMFKDPECRDLVQGTRTMQIALALEEMSDSERASFLELLEGARSKETARDRVRKELRKMRYF
ncbi:MAG: hypothetical protein C5B54_00115, partial [Acidobacteria bacterium]